MFFHNVTDFICNFCKVKLAFKGILYPLLEEAPSSQIWDNSSININMIAMAYNSLNNAKIHESIYIVHKQQGKACQ